MPRTDAEMVDLYKEAIERKLDPDLGDGVKRAADANGINVENYTLDELEAGLQKWERRAASGGTNGSLQISTLTTASVGSTSDDCE